MQLHTNTSGAGERHVGLIHGLGSDGTTWQPLIDRMLLTGRYTVTTVDLRGHGRSSRAQSYELDDFADDLVDTLPPGLHSVVGHSLGGAVLVRAISRLRPTSAIYLDPGFGLSLPTSGWRGRAFWAIPALSLGVVGALQARRGASKRAAYDAGIQASMRMAREQFDSKMAIGVFREVAHNPLVVAAPDVPSLIVLSDDAPAVLPDALATGLEQNGWQVRRIASVDHDMHLEDPDRTLEAIEDEL